MCVQHGEKERERERERERETPKSMRFQASTQAAAEVIG